MNWAIGQGYSNLMDSTNKRESAKNELGTLQMLDQQMKSDRQEKETNDLKEQAYYEQISKFSDTLLGPDKKRINEKAGALAAIVREQIKSNGGDMGKFFANGGHRILGEYKSALTNSDEAIDFQENKKNMDKLVEMQMKGFGHKISARDLANLDAYQRDGKGKVTYSGMYNDIDIPDPERFAKGEKISARMILAEKQNRTKYIGNYKLDFPDATFPPAEAELERYVNSKNGDLVGTSAQITMQNKQFDQNVKVDQRNYDNENRKFALTFGLQKDGQEFNQELQLQELDLKRQEIGLKSSKSGGGSGGVDFSNMTATEQKQYLEERGNWDYDVENMITDISYDVKGVAQVNDKVWDKYAQYFGKQGLEKFEEFSPDLYNQGATALLGIGTGIGAKIGRSISGVDSYKPRGAKRLFNGNEAAGMVKSSGLWNVDDKGYVTIDPSQNQDIFMADGSKFSDGRNLSGPLSGAIITDYKDRMKNYKYKPVGVIAGFQGLDKQGKEIIVMDAKKNPKGYNERINPTKANANLYMAFKTDDDHIVYSKINGDSQKKMYSQWAGANTASIKQSRSAGAANANAIRFDSAQKKENVKTIYQQMSSNQYAPKIMDQARMVPGAVSKGNKFAPWAMSYYVALNSTIGGKAKVSDVIATNAFNDLMSHIQSDKNLNSEFIKMTNDPKTDDRALIDFLQEKRLVDPTFANDWKQTLNFVKYTK